MVRKCTVLSLDKSLKSPVLGNQMLCNEVLVVHYGL